MKTRLESFLGTQSCCPQPLGYEAQNGQSCLWEAFPASWPTAFDALSWEDKTGMCLLRGSKGTYVPGWDPTNIGLRGWCGRIVQPAGISSALNFSNMLLDVGRAYGCIHNCLGTQHRPACTSSLDVVGLLIPDIDLCGDSMLIPSHCLPCSVQTYMPGRCTCLHNVLVPTLSGSCNRATI